MRGAARFPVSAAFIAVLAVALVTRGPLLGAEAGEDFYRGKTIRIVVGAAPGGTYDIYSRLLARHMRRHIPGEPIIIVQNRPGAGTLIAANAVYNTEPRDGTVIGTFSEGLILQQAVGGPGVEFDAAKFQWVGSLVKTAHACVARTDSAIASFQDVIEGKPFAVGTQSPGSTTYNVPAIINAALETRMKLVTGYPGVARIVPAARAGEVDGYCASWLGMLSTGSHLELLEGGITRFIIILGDKTPDHPLLKGVPAAETLAGSDQAKRLLRTVHTSAEMTNAYALPPGVPKDRVETLRKAFWAAVNDPKFRADAEKMDAVFHPSTGEQVAQMVREILSPPPAVLAKLKEILLQ